MAKHPKTIKAKHETHLVRVPPTPLRCIVRHILIAYAASYGFSCFTIYPSPKYAASCGNRDAAYAVSCGKKGDVYTASRGFGVLFREAIPNDNRKSQLRKEITTKSHTTDIKAQ